MAQLDVRPVGDQEVAGSTPGGSATFFLEVDHEIYSKVTPTDSRRAVVSFW